MVDAKDAAQAALKNIKVKAGQRYRHFKGGEYEVVAVALHEDTLEQLVIYRNLTKGTIWTRTYENFVEEVDRDGFVGKRFTLIV